jgi:integrase
MSASTSPAATTAATDRTWPWPVNLDHYNQRGRLTGLELGGLTALGPSLLRRSGYDANAVTWQSIRRLSCPLDDARAALRWGPDTRHQRRFSLDAVGLVLMRCAELRMGLWGWSMQDWADLIATSAEDFQRPWPGRIDSGVRPYVIAYAYLLGGFTGFRLVGRFHRPSLAWRVFGRESVDDAVHQIGRVLIGWGYRADDQQLSTVVCQMLLLNRSPFLRDLTAETMTRLRQDPVTGPRLAGGIHGIHRALAALGHVEAPPAPKYGQGPEAIEGTTPGWAEWVERWHATSTLTPTVRGIYRIVLAKLGRWLAVEHPHVTGPAQWTRQTCASWVAAMDRMNVGDYVQRQAKRQAHAGKPLTPKTKSAYLRVTRAFMRDCQEWDWIPRRFDPSAALGTPRSIKALLGPDPRVISDDVWAKLLWAGLNLDPADLPPRAGQSYPVELIRAVTLTWLFSGQRSDEIARLRLGCIRWQHDGMPIPGDSGEVLARDAVCLLDVPTHKTGTAFTKPVDPLLGQAIDTWQAIRPRQPAMLDRKTGERVDFLFATRARRVGKHYINNAIIPMLCRKAGVPTADVRGNITSHRARSTIASQLYNAKEPMTLFELQEWLGHRSPEATQHYAKLTPNTLARAYRDAGYFARNVRTIEVLVDRDAVASGAASTGQPWQYYDLGHGYCTYTFFEQCPHRMACARCDFYTPKPSSKGQLLEAKENLQRMLAGIPLTDDEQAAVDDGQAALDQLLGRLTDTPTPAGPTPREIGVPATATLLPIAAVNHSKPA